MGKTTMNAHGRYIVPCRELLRVRPRCSCGCPRMGMIYAIRGLSAVVRLGDLGNARASSSGMGKERIPRISFCRGQNL